MKRYIMPAGFPHKGWTALGVEDLGEPSAICEACGQEEIRYVHSLHHPVEELDIKVGCVCACHLTEDPVGPRRQEAAVKQRTRTKRRQRDRAIKAAVWRCSPKGNWWCKIPATTWRLVTWQRAGGYAAMIISDTERETIHSRHVRATKVEHLRAAVLRLIG